MNKLTHFSLVTLLLMLVSCGNRLTDVTYSTEDENGGLTVIRFYDNGKVIFTKIDSQKVKEYSTLYMCLGYNTHFGEYQRNGSVVKLARNGIVRDECIFEDGVIKWKDAEFKPDKRFSTIKRNGKYGGTRYTSDDIDLFFIDETKVYGIAGGDRRLCNYELKDGKMLIDNVDLILEEGKNKLILSNSWNTLILKKENKDYNDYEFNQEILKDTEY